MLSDEKKRPVASVVIPAYNAEETIEEAVLSALNQTEKNIEVVVCNDASTDKTLEKLESIKDSRLVILSNSENQGEGVTRDRAIAEAKGEWIAVLDADDRWDGIRLERMLNATHGETNVMVFDDLLICHHTPSGLVPWRPMRGAKAFGSDGKNPVNVTAAAWANSYQFLIKPIIHNDTLIQSKIKHTTLKFGADTEFFLKLVAYGLRFRYVPGAYYKYRIAPNSASANSSRIVLMNSMLESMLPLFEDQPEVQLAIKSRVQYRVIIQNIKEGRFVSALKVFLVNPKLLVEFIFRSIRQFVYFLHRKIHSGSSR